MGEQFFFELPGYVPPLCVSVLIFIVVGIVSLFDRLARDRWIRLLPRQQFAVVIGILLGVSLAGYLYVLGLERADKVASVIAMFIGLAGLALPLWLARPPADGDRSSP